MATTRAPTRQPPTVVKRPNTPGGNAAMARDHSKVAAHHSKMSAHHAAKSAMQSNDARREAPKNQRPRV